VLECRVNSIAASENAFFALTQTYAQEKAAFKQVKDDYIINLTKERTQNLFAKSVLNAKRIWEISSAFAI
jgi:hypothetical protein